MKIASIAQLKSRLSAYVEMAEEGTVIEVRKRNVPVAHLVGLPRARGSRAPLGFAKGSIKVRGDLTEPLIPGSDWDMHKTGPL